MFRSTLPKAQGHIFISTAATHWLHLRFIGNKRSMVLQQMLANAMQRTSLQHFWWRLARQVSSNAIECARGGSEAAQQYVCQHALESMAIAHCTTLDYGSRLLPVRATRGVDKLAVATSPEAYRW